MSTPDREAGIRAIIFLQSLAGIEDTWESASQGWDAMTISQQEDTLIAYDLMK